jgi:hypothetical protein
MVAAIRSEPFGSMRPHRVFAALTIVALTALPVRAAVHTFGVTLSTDATSYLQGDDIVLTFTAKNISRQTIMLAARHHLTSTIALVVKDAEGKNLAHGSLPKLTGDDDLDGNLGPPGATIVRQAPLSLWGYRLAPGAYAIFGTWQMEPSLEQVKSTVVNVTVNVPETPAPPPPPAATDGPMGP